ncbi:MAG TPA: diacylglycerol kinase [Ruminococcaceae bacterium]|nr:diacylglycerol kinase [Oscillospiraceae bacterium]HCT16611.1 diacylglycerol kinase [Oscillospiraceae bacterium]
MKLIAAVDNERNIGNKGGLLFSLPDDMKFFRTTTSGKIVVMGRKTLESFPGSKPLKNRVNIVLSRSSHSVDGAEFVTSVDELLEKLKQYDTDDVYVIGGAQIYSQLLPYCDTALITHVDAVADEADSKFPELKDSEWEITEQSDILENNGIKFRFTTYKRIK